MPARRASARDDEARPRGRDHGGRLQLRRRALRDRRSLLARRRATRRRRLGSRLVHSHLPSPRIALRPQDRATAVASGLPAGRRVRRRRRGRLREGRRPVSVALALRLEGLAVGSAAAVLYFDQGYSWIVFVVLLLAPDLGMLGYLAGPRVGAATYDLVHFEAFPVVLGLIGLLADADVLV